MASTTLINRKTGQKVTVPVGSQQAQILLGQNYSVDTPLSPMPPAGSTPPVVAMAQAAGFGAPQRSGVPTAPQQSPQMAPKMATLVNRSTGQRVAVPVGSQTAQQYFGQGFILETSAPAASATPAAPSGGGSNFITPPAKPPAQLPSITPTPGSTQNQQGSPAPTPTPGTIPATNGAPSPGSNSAFMMAFNQLMSKGKEFQGLQDQKNKLIQQLYDRPLTPEELRTLSPSQQEAIRNGDKSLIEFQVMTINDMIKGRADENTNALQYMLDGYKLDQVELQKKSDNARQIINNLVTQYGDLSGLTPEEWTQIQQGNVPQSAIVKLGKTINAQKLQQSNDETLSPTEAATLGVPYGTTKGAAAKLGIVPKSSGDMSQTQSANYLKITTDFQKDEIIKQGDKAISLGQLADQVIANPNSATNQLKSLYLLVKNLDPDSAVREGELGLAQQTQSYFERFKNAFVSIGKGQILSPEATKELAQATKEITQVWADAAIRRTARFRSQAAGVGIGQQFDEYIGRYENAGSTPPAGVDAKDPLGILGKTDVGGDTKTATKSGGSVSWRNNNPLNIKYGSFAANYGATQGTKATDGGVFANFPSEQAGLKAAKDLLRAPSYANLPLEQAMRRWSGNGYGADVAPSLKGKTTGQMSNQELELLIQSMRKREGWTEGKSIA